MTSILYVEDHPPARLLMQAIISEFTDFDLYTASDGQEALNTVRRTKPALYILDLDLPDGDGVVLATKLVHIHAAPIILVSAYGEAVDVASEPLISEYISKPLDPEHVAKVIKRTLAGR